MQILMIDDSPEDARLVAEALRFVAPGIVFTTVRTGEAALAWLRRRRDRVLVLLDLNLGGESGHDVLLRLKADPLVCATPVVLISSSAADADVDRAYERQASCYVTKPATFDGFVKLVEALVKFWGQTTRLPGPPPSLGEATS